MSNGNSGLDKAIAWCSDKDERKRPDFILVGAGAAGATLAARLVERGFRVIVLEMGPKLPEKLPNAVVENTTVPLLHGETTEDPRHSLRFFVKHFSDPKEAEKDPKFHRSDDQDERGIFYPRAQGVGGCAIHNAMITIAGPSEDWDEIAEITQDESWRGRRMRAYFERLEKCKYAHSLTRVGKLLSRIFGSGWENSRHGTKGWLETSLSDIRLLLNEKKFFQVIFSAARSSFFDGLENPFTFVRTFFSGRAFPSLDPNHWETMQTSPEGLAQIPCAITSDGERSSPRKRLLDVEAGPNGDHLCIVSDAFVTEVIVKGFNEESLPGVWCLPEADVYEASARHKAADSQWHDRRKKLVCKEKGEVILCGGAFNTPQLLMLSGIGPEEQLKRHGIEVKVNLPGVGENLQDRYEVPVIATLSDRFRTLDDLSLTSLGSEAGNDPQLGLWKSNASERGVYATNGGLISIFKRGGDDPSGKPDLVMFALAGYFPGYEVGWSKPGALAPDDNHPDNKNSAAAHKRKLTWLILKARTRNRNGYVRLQARSPFRRPEINMRSFWEIDDQTEEIERAHLDIAAIDNGVQFLIEMMKCAQRDGFIETYELPGIEKFGAPEEYMSRWEWIRHVAWGHHACGTCKIGGDDDPMAVLDSRFRVRNGSSVVSGLRVVDASVFPRIPGFFIVANIYMVAEKAADVLAEDHALDRGLIERQAAVSVRKALREDPVFPSLPQYEERTSYPVELEEAEARLVDERRKETRLSSLTK